jgi:uncharacterized protein YyaL (SSP411 family)
MTPSDEERPVPNRLANEISPYLLQHKDNPVDWYPWGEEALARARSEDKPLLVSIGYSACHWCHVMAHESFEDGATAGLMNQHFVNVKVDREERPDIDSLYMTAVQAMTGNGGWPLNVWVTPEGVPFFGGTYWPPEDRMGMPSFRRVLDAVADTWSTRREEILRQGDQIREALSRGPDAGAAGEEITDDVVVRAIARLAAQFDAQNGGFGGAPKFPQASVLEFLLRAYHLEHDERTLAMAATTLERMAEGGINDQIGGGFHRYAVDAIWLVPHFEKMLYDNAQLARLYLDAYRITGREHFRATLERTLSYVQQEMTSPEGAYYATQDADSEGEEGRFYVWTPEELVSALGDEDAALAARAFGVAPGGNFEGKSILTQAATAEEIAAEDGSGPEDVADRIERIRERLYEARAKRVWPGRDEKIITSWNAMMLRTFAEASRVLGRDEYRQAAEKCARFLREQVTVNGALHHTWGGGKARILGFLEDYANLIDALVPLYEATFDTSWLEWAIELTGRMLTDFAHESGAGFYDTSPQHEQLAVRPRELQDGAVPCGTSVAADVLLRMGHLTGNHDWISYGTASLQGMKQLMEDQPLGFGRYLSAATRMLGVVREVAIVAPPDDPRVKELTAAVYARFEPNAMIGLVIPDDGSVEKLMPGWRTARCKAASRPPISASSSSACPRSKRRRT